MIKRIICIFIIIAFTFCSVPVKAFALKDSDSFKLYSIPIKSNESIKDSIIGYYNQEDWFFSISDICTLTRATFEINDNIIKIKQGALSVNINIKNNTLSVGEEKTNFEIINYDKKYLVKPYALLKLLCANCMYIGEKNLLLIIMPSMTTYEAIQSNNLKSLYYNILEEGKGQFITRMTCSIFMDTFFDGLGNLLSRKETDFLESALFEVNKVDIENYNSLKTQKEDMIEKNTDTYNIISNIYNIETKLIGEIKDLIKEIDLKGSEKLLHYADMLSGLSNIGDKFITFSNIVVSAEERLNYNIDSYEIFSKTLTQENLSDVPGNYSSIINSSKNVSDKISSEFQAYYNATYDEMKKSYLNNIIDGSIKSLDKLNRSKSISSFLLAYDIGTSVTKILLPKKFKAYKADLNALYLSAVQNDICFPINYIYENLNKGFWNVTNTKRFIDMINLYNRISIAMFSNLKQSNEEFHMGYDNVKLDDLCNQAAKQTYVLYTCDPKKDICSLDDFKDYYNNDITKLIDIKKCKEYNNTLVVPIEDETTPSEIVEIPEVTTTVVSKIKAIDLIDKTIPEIISIMNGEYQIIATGNDGYVYIQNQKILPDIEFYVQVSNDDIVSANANEEIHSNSLKSNLEAGVYDLDGIQISKSAQLNRTIKADMNYQECSKVLGDFDCYGGSGGYLGGSLGSASYTYGVGKASVTLNFELVKDLRSLSSLNDNNFISLDNMKSCNPHLINIVIQKDNSEEIQEEEKAEVKPSINYEGEYYTTANGLEMKLVVSIEDDFVNFIITCDSGMDDTVWNMSGYISDNNMVYYSNGYAGNMMYGYGGQTRITAYNNGTGYYTLNDDGSITWYSDNDTIYTGSTFVRR